MTMNITMYLLCRISFRKTISEILILNHDSKKLSFLHQALKHEQQRAMEELNERHGEEQERMEDKLAREAKEEEARMMKAFEQERERALREARNRQAAELTARSDMSSDETQQVRSHS